jgi:voltage-gated potassium channel
MAMVMAMIVGYLVLPEPTGEDPPWLVFVSIAVITVIYAMAAVWALIRINRSRYPLRTGFVLLAVMVTAMVVIFALAYLSLSIDNPANFNVPLDKVASLYFTMTILSTVGFGDITAVSNSARVAVMIQMVVGLTLITALARVLVEAARQAQRRRMAEESADG